MTGAIAVLASMYLNILILILSFVNFVMIFGGLLTMGLKKKQVLRDSFLATGFLTILLLFFSSLIFGTPDEISYLVFFETLSIPFALIIGFICIALGSSLWISMKMLGFTKKQTLHTNAILSATALIIGALFELIF